MKIGFKNGNITIDSKEIDPMNMSFKGHKIELDKPDNNIDPFEMLETLATAGQADNKLEKLQRLQSAVKD